jgi:hypothetical protein
MADTTLLESIATAEPALLPVARGAPKRLAEDWTERRKLHNALLLFNPAPVT